MQGVVVRGIDPKTEGKVTDLAKNMTVGSLTDLDRRGGKTAPASSSAKTLPESSEFRSERQLPW